MKELLWWPDPPETDDVPYLVVEGFNKVYRVDPDGTRTRLLFNDEVDAETPT